MFCRVIHEAVQRACAITSQDGRGQTKDLHGSLLTLEEVEARCQDIEKREHSSASAEGKEQGESSHHTPKDDLPFLPPDAQRESQENQDERHDADVDQTCARQDECQ